MKKILCLVLGFASIAVFADANSILDGFLTQAKTMKADFSQTVISGKKSRTTTGTMEIARPNKFRWEYTQDQQLIVSDAQKIYIYDQPLQQVTVKALGKSIDKSPAAVLAGANNIRSLYKVSELPTKGDNLSWIQIEPKAANDNNGFQIVMMGFNSQNQLKSMKFTDNFGNKTNLKFSNLQTGVKIPDSDFKFKIPAGVDVAEQ
jgi:outer membrane lipoprotein carrier protein